MYEALEKAREEGTALHYQNEDTPRCPHCGEKYCIQGNEDWDLYNPNMEEHEIKCAHCEQKFKVGVIVSFYYTTRDANGENA